MPIEKLPVGSRKKVLGVPHWGFITPEASKELLPSLLHCLHKHMVQNAAVAERKCWLVMLAGPSSSMSCSFLVVLQYSDQGIK